MGKSQKIKIAFIQPNTRTLEGTTMPPLGLMYVAAVCRKAGHEVKIYDRNIDLFTFTKLKRYNPDIVGLTAFTGPCIKDVIMVAKHIKKTLSSIIILGGVHVTCLPEQTMNSGLFDFAVLGEGEETIIELIDAISNKTDLQKVKGISYFSDNKLIITAPRKLIENLDTLPTIQWDLIDAKKYFKYDIILITSRGCPGRCSFCFNHKFNQSRWRGMSAERVIEEIKSVEKLTNNKNLGFHDDNFTANRPRLYKILEYLSSDYSLFIETRVDYITEDFLKHFTKFKKVWLYFGVESGSQRILDKMHKGITVEQSIKAFELCNNYNISTTASIVLGSPTETEDEIKETFELCKKLKATRYTYCLYTPYPGSPWYDEVVSNHTFNPPDSFEGWSKFALELGRVNKSNISAVSTNYLRSLNRRSWITVVWNLIKKRDFHKIKLRLQNYQPYLIPCLDPIDKWGYQNASRKR